jgi:integrase
MMAIGDVTLRTVPRSDGTTYDIYQGEYRDRDGKRRFVSANVASFSTPKKAEKEARRLLRIAENEVEAWEHAKAKPPALGWVIDLYLKDREDAAYIRKDVSPDSYIRDRYALSLVPDKLRRMKIAEFKDSGLFEEMVKKLRTDGKAIRTVRAVLGALSSVFAFAMKAPRNYVPRNVLKDDPIKTPKPPKVRNKAELSDVLDLLGKAKNREDNPGGIRCAMALPTANLYAVLSLIAATGVRPEEALGLQVTDITRFEQPPRDRPRVWADVTIRSVSGRWGFRERTKTDQIRTVGVGKQVVEAFDEVERYWYVHEIVESPGWRSYKNTERYTRRTMLLETPRITVVGPRRQHGFMFLNTRGKPYTSHTFGDLFRAFQREVGFVKRDKEGSIILSRSGKKMPKLVLYSIRKMVATHNANRLPPHIAASITGHSVGTLLRDYVDESHEDRARAAASLGELDDLLQLEGPTNDKG